MEHEVIFMKKKKTFQKNGTDVLIYIRLKVKTTVRSNI